MPFSFSATDLPGVIAIETKLFKDNRGFFTETFKQSDFLNAGIREPFIQDNFSRSCYGVLRGLHYQKEPHGQAKLVMVSKGEIFDVAVDIRRGSPTYGKWTGLTLSGTNGCMLFIPVGFAHGFCVLSEEAYVTYKVTSEYQPAADRGIIWDDPDIQIAWPVETPLLSPKDGQLPRLYEADNDFVFKS